MIPVVLYLQTLCKTHIQANLIPYEPVVAVSVKCNAHSEISLFSNETVQLRDICHLCSQVLQVHCVRKKNEIKIQIPLVLFGMI